MESAHDSELASDVELESAPDVVFEVTVSSTVLVTPVSWDASVVALLVESEPEVRVASTPLVDAPSESEVALPLHKEFDEAFT